MSLLHKKETARQAYIRILKMIDSKIDEQPHGDRDITLMADLIAAGHLKGVTRMNQLGMPADNAVTGMGVDGRLFLELLQKAEIDDSIWGSLRRAGDVIIGFILGIVGSVAGAVILHLLHL